MKTIKLWIYSIRLLFIHALGVPIWHELTHKYLEKERERNEYKINELTEQIKRLRSSLNCSEDTIKNLQIQVEILKCLKWWRDYESIRRNISRSRD